MRRALGLVCAVLAGGLDAGLPPAGAAKLSLSQSSGAITYEGAQGAVDADGVDPYESSDLRVGLSGGRYHFEEFGNHPELFTLATSAKSDATHDRCAIESQDSAQTTLSCNAAIVNSLTFKLERGEDGLDLSDIPAGASLGSIAIFGGAEADTIQGSPLPESISGGDGEDSIDAGDGADQIAGGPEDGLDDDDPASFGDGDTVNGDEGADDISGQGGEDDLNGGDGSDVVRGGARDDNVSGDADPDSLYGDDGDDLVYAANDDTDNVIDCGDDTGPSGGDYAQIDKDGLDPEPVHCEDVVNPPPPPPPPPPGPSTGTISVASGKLTFSAAAHNETITVESGSGTISLEALATNLCCIEFQYEINVSPLNGGGCTVGPDPAMDPVAKIRATCPAGGIDSVQIDSAGESKVVNASALRKPLTYNGGNGNDWVEGTPYADLISTGDNVTFGDKVNGNGGADTIDAGPGGDTIDGGGDGDRLIGGSGQDLIIGGPGNDTLDGGSDGDSLFPGADSDEVIGGDGADRVDYSDSSAAVKVDLDGKRDDGIKKEDLVRADVESIYGSLYDDLLTGNKGDNTLAGSGGADKLKGGTGNDFLLLLDSPPLADKSFSCAAGDDSVLFDSADAAKFKLPRSCEHNIGAGPVAPPARSAAPAPAAKSAKRCLDVTLMGKYNGCLRDADGDGVVRISCVGDSNTFWFWTNPNYSWCVRIGLGASGNVEMWTRGGLGAATTPHYEMGTYPGPVQVDDSLGAGRADIVAIAFGTNDIDHGAPPNRAATAIRRLVQKVERSKAGGKQGRRAIVLGAPPKLPFDTPSTADIATFNPKIAALNGRLARILQPRQFVAHPDLVHDDSIDGVHMAAGGQLKRAEAVAKALTSFDERQARAALTNRAAIL